jgi:type IV secretion system protein VirB8
MLPIFRQLLNKLSSITKMQTAALPLPQEVNKSALDFETSVVYLAHESEKRAWLIAFTAAALAFVLAIALMLLIPLKTVEPYVIRYDSTTGHTDIITSITQQNVDVNEAVSKYFVQKYVQLREGYYYEMLQQDYNLVQIFGSNSVNDEYRMLYTGKNSRDAINGARVVEKVDIISVVLGQAAELKTATVRIKILTYDKSNMKKPPTEKNKVVTLAYEYAPNTKMSEFQRLNNPLGFRVATYRVDNEVTR